jgi:hypothetical protein
MSILKQMQQAVAASRREIIVEGMGDDGASLVLYASPVSMGDIDRAKRKNADMTSGEFMAEIIIAKCEDDAGNKAFTIADKPGLLRLPMQTVLGMFNQIFSVTDAEDHAKN